jgi:ribosome-binding protein aMBF1 (putative translation factor)
VNAQKGVSHGERTRHELSAEVAAVINGARLRCGWSYRQAARKCGTVCGYLHMLEHGSRCPSVVMAEALISGLRLNLNEADQLRAVALRGVGRDFDQDRYRRERLLDR